MKGNSSGNGNHQFMDEELTGEMVFRQKITAYGCGFRPAR
jgi:hypothetical protein